MVETARIAAVQINPELMNPPVNLEKVISAVNRAASNRANLIVFPECSLSGYIFSSREEALPFAETIPGPVSEKVATLCKEFKVYIIIGLLEKANDKLYNTAAFIGPDGLIGKYHKNHLPFIGVDRFVNHGDKPFEVYQTPIGNIGIEICYDIMFPESARVMFLTGAEILAVPTNFPSDRAADVIKHVIPARAIENSVYVVAADRTGNERGYSFAGRSKIVGPSGKAISQASADKEEIIYGEIDLEQARQKHLTTIPGEYEVDRFKDRRPELYGKITEPVDENK
jgi:predicted amidohydrolase